MITVRQPAVAGKFYPAERPVLQKMVTEFLGAAESSAAASRPKAIIGPHAGYIYSGPIAGSAYAPWQGALTVSRVVLLGPAHWVPVRGLAASSAAAFATPLGQVPLDREAQEMILELPQVRLFDAAHEPEHGLEVHLPFLQTVFSDFSLVPLVVGQVGAAEVAEVLRLLWGGPETAVVISSDLSHYENHATATRLDRQTAAAIEQLAPLAESQACGRLAINGLLHLAREQGLVVETADLRNSGDTAGPPGRVVGYGAFLFREALS